MTARDDLAAIIFPVYRSMATAASPYAKEAADAIIAAGWKSPAEWAELDSINEQIHAMNRRLCARVVDAEAKTTTRYVAPHGPDEPCTCDGCSVCSGRTLGCTCDIDWDAMYEGRQ